MLASRRKEKGAERRVLLKKGLTGNAPGGEIILISGENRVKTMWVTRRISPHR